MPKNIQYRNQHYLPVCYLRFFSFDPKAKVKIIYIWNAVISVPKNIKSVCCEDFCYSENDADYVEKLISRTVESPYAPAVTDILAGKPVLVTSILSVFKFAVYQKFRSPAYINKTDKDRYTMLNKVIGTALKKAFPEIPIPIKQTGLFLQNAMMNYSCKIVTVPQAMIISDSPVIMLVTKGSEKWEAIVMPITPTRLVVYYRQESVICDDVIQEHDYKQLFLHMRYQRYGQFMLSSISLDNEVGEYPLPPPGNEQMFTDHTSGHYHGDLDLMFRFIRRKK